MVDYKVVGKVVVLEVDNPPVNALSVHVREGLVNGMNKANSDSSVKVIVICGKGKFLAGADIREFGTGVGKNKPTITDVTFAIEDSQKPVVAGIKGFAFGGGLEVALGCHYRIGHSNVQLGFPEVDIGLLPGATGTQRFPRVVGLKTALSIIPSGRRFGAKEALSLGVLDEVTQNDDVLAAAITLAERVADRPFADRRTSRGPIKDAENPQKLMEDALAVAKKRNPGALAPVFNVRAVMGSVQYPREVGLQKERELFEYLQQSYQARALQYAFFSQRVATKWEILGASHSTTKPRALKTGAVVGAGTMGTGIAMSMLNAGIPVVLLEQNQKFLDTGVKAVRDLYAGSVRLGKMTTQQAKKRLSALKPSLEYADLQSVDVVIEAVYEDMGLKKEVFKKLDAVCKPDALLWSNTSYLNIDEMASVTSRPERVLGAHFFVPAYHMKLLENVRGKHTSPETIATAMSFGSRIGKVPVLVGNCHGFVGNRMLSPMGSEAQYLLEEGCLPYQVDEVSEMFGFTLGVLKVSDLSGLDIGYKTRQSMAAKAGVILTGHTRYLNGQRHCPLSDILVEKGRLGRKTGKGFYRYEKPHAKVPYNDDDVTDVILEYCKELGLERRVIPTQEILERLLYGLINTGFKILEEGIASKPEDIDTIWLLGYGWPKYYGGPMFYANMVGAARIYERVCHYWEKYPLVPHWQPSLLLKKVAENNIPMKKWNQAASQSRL